MTSIVIAVAAAIWTPPPALTNMVPHATGLEWVEIAPSEWPHPTSLTVYRSALHSIILYQAVVSADAWPSDHRTSHWQTQYQFGWPFHSLEMRARSMPAGPASIFWASNELPRWVRPSQNSLARIPLHPLFAGSAIDAVLFGLLWLSMYRGVVSLKRLARSLAGRCPECGYPYEPSTGCPECGWNRPSAEKRSNVLPND